MVQTERWSSAARVLRGLMLVMAGVMLLYMAGCGRLGGGSAKNGKTSPEEGQRTVYSGLHYAMVQGQAIHKPSGSDDREYVFIPLTLRNRGNTIVFSSYACVEAYAVPGGQGVTPLEYDCRQCGQCYLNLTGGICPITACSKSLINGQCGGAKDGKCEVDPNMECGWERIQRRLAMVGRLDVLRSPVRIRDYGNEVNAAE